MGDTIVATAAVRCLKEQYPGIKVSVDSPFPEVWEHNPYITNDPNAQPVPLDNSLIQVSNQRPVHFLHNYTSELSQKLQIPVTLTVNRPDLHLSADEKRYSGLPAGRYALINAGRKDDFQTKHWGGHNYQALVDELDGIIKFIQVGHSADYHPVLRNTINFIGFTSVRELIRLAYHSDFGIGPVTALHHIYAALRKPYVCLAGGLEAKSWEDYPTATMFSAIGKLPCCQDGGCWRSKFQPGQGGGVCALPVLSEGKDPVPFCLDMVRPETVAETVRVFYQSGLISRGEPLTLPERIFPERPSVGLVISTFGSVPYVHLALAAARRVQGERLPILVTDDASEETGALAALCERYGASFHCNPYRLGWQSGDMASFVAGLSWASARGLDLLVKQSRRFIPLRGWVDELAGLAEQTQYATYSGECRGWGYGFRTECVGLAVRPWLTLLDALRGQVKGGLRGLPEAVLHGYARTLHLGACNVCREWERHNPRENGKDGYGVWPLLGTSRREKREEVLWHETDSPQDYARVGREFGLDYSAASFKV